MYDGAHKPDGFNSSVIDPYFESLFQRIQHDTFVVPRSEWDLCGFDVRRGTYCPELWARDSNGIVCTYAYGKYTNGSDLLSSGYAKEAFPIVELQLAKAAWRLAGWLNAIAAIHFGVEGFDMSLPGLTQGAKYHDSRVSAQEVLGDMEL